MAWAARNLISTQVKTAERMVEAMKSEIAKKHRAEEGAGWQPVSALVRDALRATVVCPGAQAMCDVKAAFDASPSAQTKALRRVAESWPPRRRRDASSMASAPDSLIDLRIGEPALHAKKT